MSNYDYAHNDWNPKTVGRFRNDLNFGSPHEMVEIRITTI